MLFRWPLSWNNAVQVMQTTFFPPPRTSAILLRNNVSLAVCLNCSDPKTLLNQKGSILEIVYVTLYRQPFFSCKTFANIKIKLEGLQVTKKKNTHSQKCWNPPHKSLLNYCLIYQKPTREPYKLLQTYDQAIVIKPNHMSEPGSVPPHLFPFQQLSVAFSNFVNNSLLWS